MAIIKAAVEATIRLHRLLYVMVNSTTISRSVAILNNCVPTQLPVSTTRNVMEAEVSIAFWLGAESYSAILGSYSE